MTSPSHTVIGKNIVMVSGPAGSGKDTLIDNLIESGHFERVVTTTSRALRPHESEGHPYYFVDRTFFEEMIVRGEFAEYSTNENNEYYGVTLKELDRFADSHILGILKPDWKGVTSIKKLFPNIPAIYISVPLESLEKRLRERDAEKSEEYFQERNAYTKEWLKHLDIYDYTITNEDGKLSEATKELNALIKKITRT